MKTAKEWAKEFTIYEIDNVELVNKIQADAWNAGREAAEKLLLGWKVNTGSECHYMQASIITKIRALKMEGEDD